MSYGGYIERALPLLERLVKVQERRADLAEANANRDATGEGLLLPGEITPADVKAAREAKTEASKVETFTVLPSTDDEGGDGVRRWVVPIVKGIRPGVALRGPSETVYVTKVEWDHGPTNQMCVRVESHNVSTFSARSHPVRDAVANLQQVLGLTADGIVGRQTVDAMKLLAEYAKR